MANALYDKGREGFLGGDIAWDSDNIKCTLVDLGLYTPDLVNHEFLSDVPLASQVAISGNFINKTITAGVADADDIIFPLVVGNESEALVIYQDTGASATSRLIAFIDTATGLPVTPNGGNISVLWSNGVDKIFKL